MHSGKIGGGRRGVGKAAFLQWSRLKPTIVVTRDGAERSGLVVTALDRNIVGRVRRFVKTVHDFKAAVRRSDFTPARAEALTREVDRYTREFSGWKSGSRSSEIEFLSYHGDVVDELYREATAANDDDEVFVGSTGLIDLYIRRNGRIAELFEVKTGVRRQALYTAIGQLMTHSASLPGDVTKWLVVPADEQIADDLARAIRRIGIRLRRF